MGGPASSTAAAAATASATAASLPDAGGGARDRARTGAGGGGVPGTHALLDARYERIECVNAGTDGINRSTGCRSSSVRLKWIADLRYPKCMLVTRACTQAAGAARRGFRRNVGIVAMVVQGQAEVDEPTTAAGPQVSEVCVRMRLGFDRSRHRSTPCLPPRVNTHIHTQLCCRYRRAPRVTWARAQ